MICPSFPANEAERLEALRRYRVLDTPAESAFDDIVSLTSQICETPISLVSLVDESRQWFKAAVGLDAPETPRDISFCGHAILQSGVLIVEDALADPRFADNPLVTGPPNVRFYAGAPLVTREGHALGTLCAIDHEPRCLTSRQRQGLEAMARQVVRQFELRLTIDELGRLGDELAFERDVKNRFMASVSHELRTPLAAILGFAEEIGQIAVTDPDRRWMAGRIIANGRQLLGLINGVMDLTQLDGGSIVPSPERVDVRSLAEDLEELHRPDALGRRIEFAVSVEAGVPVTLDFDPIRFRQVVSQLIDNAIKFTDHGSVKVGLDVEPATGALRVEVRDTGRGIASNDQDRVFEPFVKIAGQEGIYAGLGVGLHLVRTVVNQIGGKIHLESRPGHGSVFTVTFPARDRSSEPLPALRPPRSLVLLVEDNLDLARVYQRFLGGLNCEVVHARDGAKAIAMALGTERPELVLLDMKIPVRDGYDVAATLRGHGFDKPIIAITASVLQADRRRCLAVGCSDFVSKPVAREAFEEKVRRYLPVRQPDP